MKIWAEVSLWGPKDDLQLAHFVQARYQKRKKLGPGTCCCSSDRVEHREVRQLCGQQRRQHLGDRLAKRHDQADGPLEHGAYGHQSEELSEHTYLAPRITINKLRRQGYYNLVAVPKYPATSYCQTRSHPKLLLLWIHLVSL
ncbi:hypothetical protein FOCC_FOCC016593 [Frankliniella occidentalis]|nr:hypothetical protein FOCC_FOCC016593 [Frankliniella occidentalis]